MAPNGSMKTACSPLIRKADWPYQRMRIECRLPLPFELGLTFSQREQFLRQLVLELGEPPLARADELELLLDERHGRFDYPGALAVARGLCPLIAQRGASLFRLRKRDELVEREP